MTARVYVDTNVLIAAFETVGPASPHGWALLRACEAGEFVAVTSEITLAELLPRPLAKADQELIDTYLALLVDRSIFRVVPISREILFAAALLRSQTASLKLPDAIHVATATANACAAFLSEDLRVGLPAGLKRVRLADGALDDLRRLAP